MPSQFANRCNIIRLFVVAVQCEALGNLPYEYLPIIGAGGDNSIIERIPNRVSAVFGATGLYPPVCVQHRPSVSSKERDLLRQATFLVDWYDCEGASTAGFPIDGKIFWICLDSLSARPSSRRPGRRREPSPDWYPMRCDLCAGCRSKIPSSSASQKHVLSRCQPDLVPCVRGGTMLTILRRAHETACHDGSICAEMGLRVGILLILQMVWC